MPPLPVEDMPVFAPAPIPVRSPSTVPLVILVGILVGIGIGIGIEIGIRAFGWLRSQLAIADWQWWPMPAPLGRVSQVLGADRGSLAG